MLTVQNGLEGDMDWIKMEPREFQWAVMTTAENCKHRLEDKCRTYGHSGKCTHEDCPMTIKKMMCDILCPGNSEGPK